jgi:hypothetical protein
MEKKPDLYGIIHLIWVITTLLLYWATNKGWIPDAIAALGVWWGLIGFLSFLMVMIRSGILRRKLKQQEEEYQKAMHTLKSEMFDLEKTKVEWQRKAQVAEAKLKKSE